MPKLSPEKWTELEGFWRHHHEGWKNSALNQQEYCELHGLPLKRFGNWRALFKSAPVPPTPKLLYRRDRLSHMTDKEISDLSVGYIPSARAVPDARRSFSLADKQRILAEADRPGTSISAVARRYGIATRVLFRWKRELASPEKPAKACQKDVEARWTVKFSKAKPAPDGTERPDIAIPTFGYKAHISIDRRHGVIRRHAVTDAAAHGGARLREGLIDPNNTASATSGRTPPTAQRPTRLIYAASAKSAGST